MLKLTRWFIWGLFSLLLLTAIDQLLLRVDLAVHGYAQVHVFYVDFRTRLLNLTGKDPVGKMISASKKKPPVTKKTSDSAARVSRQAESQNRYLYVDGEGSLQFADSLNQVPLQYRRDAQPLSE